MLINIVHAENGLVLHDNLNSENEIKGDPVDGAFVPSIKDGGFSTVNGAIIYDNAGIIDYGVSTVEFKKDR